MKLKLPQSNSKFYSWNELLKYFYFTVTLLNVVTNVIWLIQIPSFNKNRSWLVTKSIHSRFMSFGIKLFRTIFTIVLVIYYYFFFFSFSFKCWHLNTVFLSFSLSIFFPSSSAATPLFTSGAWNTRLACDAGAFFFLSPPFIGSATLVFCEPCESPNNNTIL